MIYIALLIQYVTQVTIRKKKKTPFAFIFNEMSSERCDSGCPWHINCNFKRRPLRRETSMNKRGQSKGRRSYPRPFLALTGTMNV